MEMAQDDTLAGPQIVAFYDALKAAGYKPEFHIYTSGGHGWGMRKQGKSSDHWIDDFYYWLEAQGLTRPQSQAQTGDAIFPKGELSTTKNHTGNIWLKELNVGDSTFDPSIAVATYDAGCKAGLAYSSGWSSPTYCGRHRLLPGTGKTRTNSSQGGRNKVPSGRGALARCIADKRLCLSRGHTDSKGKNNLVGAC